MLCSIYYHGRSITARGAVVDEWHIFPDDYGQCSCDELRHFPYVLRRYGRGEYYLFTRECVMIERVHVTDRRKYTVSTPIIGNVSRTPGIAYITL